MCLFVILSLVSVSQFYEANTSPYNDPLRCENYGDTDPQRYKTANPVVLQHLKTSLTEGAEQIGKFYISYVVTRPGCYHQQEASKN